MSSANINFEDWNFPRCYPLYHFRLDELDLEVRKIARLFYILFLILVCFFFVNFVTSFVLAVFAVRIFGVFYSFLNMIIGTIIGVTCFHGNYKALASKSNSSCQKYLFFQSFLCLLATIIVVGPPFSSFHGFWAIVAASDSSIAPFWITMCLIQSFLLLAYIGLGWYAVILANKYRQGFATINLGTFSPLKV
eukprot:c14003_g1_i1.p1 GENE.c14003_g1_i1~~c14003_g1_i1.p1  ORF type:complete len:192 (+),score=38.40 c14003_g1_i1:39-614(+)